DVAENLGCDEPADRNAAQLDLRLGMALATEFVMDLAVHVHRSVLKLDTKACAGEILEKAIGPRHVVGHPGHGVPAALTLDLAPLRGDLGEEPAFAQACLTD